MSFRSVVLLLVVSGCEELGLDDGSDSSDTGATSAGDDDDDGGGGDDDDDDGKPARGWAAIPLIDDGDVWHTGNDLVTGIHFTDRDHGIIVTAGDNNTFADGGAVFGATEREVTDVRFGGDGALCLLGTIDYNGIVPTADGYVAMAHACDIIASHDGGDRFDITLAGVGEPFGIEDVLAYGSADGRTVLIRDTGVVSVTEYAPGPDAIWDDIWAPTGVPTTPDPVPRAQCQTGPDSNNVPSVSQTVYLAPDTSFIAYTSQTDRGPEICVSRDGGYSFFPHRLEGVDEDIRWQAPTGVLFNTADNGITWLANNIYPDATYIFHTTDAGETWSPVELPSDIQGVDIELRQAFFAPNSEAGFIVGYDYEHDIPLMLQTTDNGASFSRVRGDFAQVATAAGGAKLWTGFALDEDHIWVGGEYGLLMASDIGAE